MAPARNRGIQRTLYGPQIRNGLTPNTSADGPRLSSTLRSALKKKSDKQVANSCTPAKVIPNTNRANPPTQRQEAPPCFNRPSQYESPS